MGGESSGGDLEDPGAPNLGGKGGESKAVTETQFPIYHAPATCRVNAPDRSTVQAIPSPATLPRCPLAAPAAHAPARGVARGAHAPATKNLQLLPDDPRSSRPSVLHSDASSVQFQGHAYVYGTSIFNSRFRVEAKEFVVSVEASGIVKLTEWGQKISNAISMGRFGARWMVSMVDKLRVAGKLEDFVAKYTESPRAFLAQRRMNSRGRYLTITQYGERRRRGVVMVPEGVNGEGWSSISRAFRAVVDFFVAREKVKRQTVGVRTQPGMTYAEVTRAQPDARINEGQPLMPKLKGTMTDDAHGSFSRDAEIRAHIQALKGEVDELLKLVGNGPLVGSKMSCCQKCGAGMNEFPAKGLSSNLVHKNDKQVMIEPIGEPQEWNPKSVTLIENGATCSILVGESDTIPPAGGVVSVEEDIGLVLAQETSPAVEEEQETTGSATTIVNTYNRRFHKLPQERDPRTETAMVVWVDGANKRTIDKDVTQVEEVEGRIFDSLGCGYAREIMDVNVLDSRPPPSNWVLQKIMDFSKMVGVSCDGYESRLMQLFEELEASRGQETRTPGGKARRKGDRELKRLECSINYDMKGGESKKGMQGRDEGQFQ